MMAKQKYNIYISFLDFQGHFLLLLETKGYKETQYIRLAFNVLGMDKKMPHHGNNYEK